VLLRRLTPLLLGCCLVGLTACDTDDGRELPPAGPDQTATIATSTTLAPTDAALADAALADAALADAADAEAALTDEGAEIVTAGLFTVTAPWGEGQGIPVTYTCEGDDRIPAITWTGVPAGTVEVAVVLTDLDAEGFVHWIVFGLDPAGAGIPDGGLPEGIPQALNSFGTVGYGGPCPPTGTHTYLLEVYALSQQLELSDGAPASDLLTAITAASIGLTSVSGTFTAG
jgi:Raf kinase inhibitor-like YbhB/YbcL family protein